MPLFKVTIKRTEILESEYEADDEDDARQMAEDGLGGDWEDSTGGRGFGDEVEVLDVEPLDDDDDEEDDDDDGDEGGPGGEPGEWTGQVCQSDGTDSGSYAFAIKVSPASDIDAIAAAIYCHGIGDDSALTDGRS